MRKTLIVLMITGVAVGGALVGPAGAGGGPHCGQTMTEGRTPIVRLALNCFNPTITRVASGEEVTFVNEDSIAHTVTGALFTFGAMDELGEGDRVAYRFEDEGIFPYTCVLHPGMVGAIVVGDGKGTGTSTVTGGTITSARDAKSTAAEGVRDQTTTTSAQLGTARPWSLALGLFLVLGSLIVVSTRIRKRVTDEITPTTKP